jgi:phenylacetyl-CoA:acceptor oxidoreductase 27-kDa subunit
MTRYGMVIDLGKCVGCASCVAACMTYHATPKGVQWNTMNFSEIGTYPNVSKLMLPKACQQCDNTPCVKVCPTGATYKRADGIVMVDYSKCIGCKYCIAACPYDARTFLQTIQPYYGSGLTSLESSSPNQVAGVVEKCTFCANKIDAGLAKGLTPGVDRDATPACVATCPAGARYFGDLDDPNSNVSTLISENRAVQLGSELGTKPKVYYIPFAKAAIPQEALT